MLHRERFGKLVLLEELEDVHLGATYRAARLGPSGLDRIVTLLRYSEALSAHSHAAAQLMDQTRRLSRLQSPGLVRILGIGRVGQSYYASYEAVPGRSLRAVIDRARRESFPLAAENALMVASRAGAVLEALHARQDESGVPLFHGLLTPTGLVVSWEGEVRLREVGLWSGLRDTELLGEDERRGLAPEQAAGEAGDARSDVHALGLVLLEMLTRWSPDGSGPLEALSSLRCTTVAGEEEPLPEALEGVLRRALAPSPAARYASMEDMRKAIDTLLYAGDFTPTTFNLAFFMQTLFREDMEREAQALEEARQADYTEFLSPPADPVAHSQPAAAEAAAAPAPAPERGPRPAPEASPDAGDPRAPDPSSRSPRPRRPASLPPSGTGRLFAQSSKPMEDRRGRALAAGLALALLMGGGGSYLYHTTLRPEAPAPATSTPGPDFAAALARVRELEARLAQLEREKSELEAASAESGEAPLGASVTEHTGPPAAAPAPPPGPDPDVQARAAARRQARAERARREEQIGLLEAELRAAQGRLVAEQEQTGGVDLGSALPILTAPLPTPEPVPPPTTVAPVRRGELVSGFDPEVSDPQLVDEGPGVPYPTVAWKLRRGAVVTVAALVSEEGTVQEVKAVESTATGLGFEAAAEQKVRAHRYLPATKRGVPVRVRILVPVRFSP